MTECGQENIGQESAYLPNDDGMRITNLSDLSINPADENGNIPQINEYDALNRLNRLKIGDKVYDYDIGYGISDNRKEWFRNKYESKYSRDYERMDVWGNNYRKVKG